MFGKIFIRKTIDFIIIYGIALLVTITIWKIFHLNMSPWFWMIAFGLGNILDKTTDEYCELILRFNLMKLLSGDKNGNKKDDGHK